MMFQRLGRAALFGALVASFVGVGIAVGHEPRAVKEVTLTVGFLDEPVYSGQKSGLDLRVSRGDTPIEGLEQTLEAEVTYGGQTRDLPIAARSGEPGAYQSVFFPTAAGPYTFRIFGEVDGEQIDESFTSGPETFSEVQDVAGGQFPVVYPGMGDIVRTADAGAGAATTATIALILGAAGLLAGLMALGITLARRRA